MMMAAVGIIEQADGELSEEQIRAGAGGQPLPLHGLPEHRHAP